MATPQEFKIQFAEKKPFFESGSTVNGTVSFGLKGPLSLRSLRLKFYGKIHTEWEETRTENDAEGKPQTITEKFSAKHSILSEKVTLWGDKDATQEVMLNEGVHKFPFQFKIPDTAETSFEGEHGWIRYSVKASFDRHGEDFKTVEKFNVRRVVDVSGCMAPVDTDSHPPVCCLCPCIKSESKIYVKLPKSGYVPGETINIDAQVKNASRFFTLKNISFRLHRRTIFKADGGRTRATYANVVTSSELSDVVPPKKKASVAYALTIPESTLPMIRSDYITTDYFLTVSAKPDFFLLCTLTMDTDIKIGTTGSSEKKGEAKPVEIAKTVAHEEHH